MLDRIALDPPTDSRLVRLDAVATRLDLDPAEPAVAQVVGAASAMIQGDAGIGRSAGWQRWSERLAVARLPRPAVVLSAWPVGRLVRLEVAGENRAVDPPDGWRLAERLLYVDDAASGALVEVEYWAGWWLPGWPAATEPLDLEAPALPDDLVVAAETLAEALYDGAGLDGVVSESAPGGARLQYDTAGAMSSGVRRIVEAYR